MCRKTDDKRNDINEGVESRPELVQNRDVNSIEDLSMFVPEVSVDLDLQ